MLEPINQKHILQIPLGENENEIARTTRPLPRACQLSENFYRRAKAICRVRQILEH